MKKEILCRIPAVLLMLCLLGNSLSLSAQKKKKISIAFQYAKLEKVMSEIKKQTNYLFVNRNVETGRIVSVDIKDMELEKALSAIFDPLDVNWEIKGDNIIISPKILEEKKEKALRQISGRVTDASGTPVVGAYVMVKGNREIGTITNLEGNYSLEVPQSTKIIEVTCLGYKNAEMELGKRNEVSIRLQDDSIMMEGTVVTALGIKREQKALSYNVQQIKGDELTTVKDANFVNSLVGKVAGVQINAGANGPGGSSRVIMRGMKSIEKSNGALYVIDGIPMYNHSFGGGGGTYGQQGGSESAADINPDDIESINMLTGPSAAALYGSDAANGVVIINTKKGLLDRTSVTVSNSSAFSTITMLPQMQNSYGTEVGLMSWGEAFQSSYNPAKFFNTGTNIINSVSLATGNSKNQTYISASSTNATGTLPNNRYDRLNFTARNTTTFANNKLVLDLGAGYIIQNNRNMVSQGKYYNPLPALYLFPRGDDFDEIRSYERWNPVLGYMTQYWPYGVGAHSLQNPYWIQHRMVRLSEKHRYMLNASLKWNILDWLNFTGRVRVDNSEYRLRNKFYASTLTTFCDSKGGYEDQRQEDRSLYGDLMLNVDKRIANKFSIVATLGASINDQKFESAGGAGNLILTNFFALNNINYLNKYKSIQEGWHDQTQSVFGSVELGYKDFIYLTLTGRNDWASQLAFSDQPSFFYPSAGLSSVVSNIVEMPAFVSFMKIRASYSKVASAFERFLSNPSYKFNSQTHLWERPNTAPLENMRPEETRAWELGLNSRFFKNTLHLDITYYRSNTYNQTIYGGTSSSSTYSKKIVQTGNVQNQGIEMALGYNNKWGRFSLSSTLTYTMNRNKIIRLAKESVNAQGIPEIQKDYLGANSVAPQVILYENGSLGDIYVKHELARDLNGNVLIDPVTGDMKIREVPLKKAGQLAPLYNLGWSGNLSYFGLDLGFVVAARVGGLCYSATQGILDYYGVSKASADARDAGGVEINYGKVPARKYYKAIATAEGGYGTYYLYSATNVRLQELSLSYTLPEKWFCNKMKMTLGLIGRNLWMIYCKAPFDPEVSAATSSNYYQGVDYFMQPSTRNIGFNVRMQF